MSALTYEQWLANVLDGQRHVDRVGQCYWCGAQMDDIDWAESRRTEGHGECDECKEKSDASDKG